MVLIFVVDVCEIRLIIQAIYCTLLEILVFSSCIIYQEHDTTKLSALRNYS